ncbi:unnamed protein product [Paramecium sonneborni]|uniref:C2 NT-type domain-containing protein n=1 Tax=Paramecium sonneborni TaxID=65129 RepID=A0A8S1MHW6_9CILI|nr:unnamed protein product [Paramecium sonneborni]
MNPKGYKFQVQIHIEKLEMKSVLSFQIQVILKCGNQKVQTQQLADFNQGKGIINETLAIQTNVYQINGTYQEKKIELLILLITPKGNKKAGQCYIDIAEKLNQQKYDINEELILENCPDSKAKIYSKIQLTQVGEVEFDTVKSQSSTVNEQISDKKQGIFTPFKAVLESTAKKYFGDQSPIQENCQSKSLIKNPSVTDVSSQFTSPKQQQKSCQVQSDLQHLYEELNQQKIQYIELKDQNNQLKQELQTEKVKKETLILQVQEQKKQIEKMIDQNIYQEQIYQYEQQLSQIQSQLRQAQKDNENLTQNYKKSMQKYNKLSDEYNQYQNKINSEDKSSSSLNKKLQELEEACYQKDQLYSILQKSNNDSQMRNINFENQIIQLNQEILQLQNKLDEKEVVIDQSNEKLNSLNSILLKLQDQNSFLEQNLKMQKEKIDEQSQQNLNQQQQIIQLKLEIQKQQENFVNQNNEIIEKFKQELNEKNDELNEYLTLFEQEKQKHKLEIDEYLEQIKKLKQETNQTQLEQDEKYRDKQQNIENELQKYHLREMDLKAKVQFLMQQTNQLQQVLNDSISQAEVMRKLFLDPQIPNTEADLPNQLIELNRAITFKFSKLKQDLEYHQQQILDHEKNHTENTSNQQQTLELIQTKLKLDNLQNQNLHLEQQLISNQELLNNFNQLALSQEQKIQNLEILYKEALEKSISEKSINQLISEQNKIFDLQNQDLQIQTKALQIQILEKDDLINNLSTQIQQQNQQNQEQIIINEQLSFQVKEQLHNIQQIEQENQIMKTEQDHQTNNLIMQNASQEKVIVQLREQNSILNEQIIYLKEQLENFQIVFLQQQNQIQHQEVPNQQLTLIQKQNNQIQEQEDLCMPTYKETEIPVQLTHTQQLEDNSINFISKEEFQNNLDQQNILKQQIESLKIQINQQTSDLTKIQIAYEEIKNENIQIVQIQKKYQLKETELQMQIEQLQALNQNLQNQENQYGIKLNYFEEEILQKNNKIEELEVHSQQVQLRFQDEIQELQQQLFVENEEWQKQKELIQQYIDELEHKALDLNNQLREKDNELENMIKLNQKLNDQLIQLQNINEKAQKLEQLCQENKQKFEQQIDEINLKNISKNNEFIKQLQQLQQQSQEDQIRIQEIKKQLNEKEMQVQDKEGKHSIEIQLITTNYMNRLKDKDDVIQNLQQEIQSYQQVEQEQQNVIKFLENVKENLEQQKSENFEYIQKIQLTNEKIIQQTEQQESQINQLKNAIKELELKNHELETEKINISNNYQQALIEAQSLNHTQDNSSEIIEKMQEEVVLLKCRIGDMFNAALEFGGTKLVDKLQQALGIKE